MSDAAYDLLVGLEDVLVTHGMLDVRAKDTSADDEPRISQIKVATDVLDHYLREAKIHRIVVVRPIKAVGQYTIYERRQWRQRQMIRYFVEIERGTSVNFRRMRNAVKYCLDRTREHACAPTATPMSHLRSPA